ncbi:hypothetical protein [Borrelia miyamotoi]|uniref:Uncharacterized protein n=1 Tax=Borrelia miyamotoi TaxID=47466 RepID=A0AAQ2WVR0_9SPIR|nr:hypothetical protein [Borrelia miyamotoi]AOW96189.1 hypothetical protein AXH25_05815 [Borrelia miyamotoi]WAZ85647.1 hypothetical protein O5400_04685 [Borrelia miyamotoi]WAZ85683.1 hypothetical protein O5400_04895 [Borrelia miyamotoi]WAZ91430.1 hypothetical protein O5398_04680 [Borrelia miyamotoi]WAZ91464.1 hypothetical protein O5398_04885 [Borrelia miyamotoi]
MILPIQFLRVGLGDNKGWALDSLETLIIEMKRYNWNFTINKFNDSEVLELFFKHNLNYIAVSTGIASSFGRDTSNII